ncbi:MAG: (d)CMP kinase [Thermodesulfobacteriota bacterium]
MKREEVITEKSFIIAVDGPGGVGKSTVSRLVAEELGGIYVNTGAMYRAFGLAMNKAEVDLVDEAALKTFCQDAEVVYRPDSGGIFLNGADYREEVRSEEAGALASKVALNSLVRRTLVAYQRTFINNGDIVVMEGRDIGTVVFPEADIKFFLDADSRVRARRRQRQGSRKKKTVEIEKNLARRDRQDMKRKDSPLEQAPDAIYVDTTNSDIGEVVNLLLTHIKKRLPPL